MLRIRFLSERRASGNYSWTTLILFMVGWSHLDKSFKILRATIVQDWWVLKAMRVWSEGAASWTFVGRPVVAWGPPHRELRGLRLGRKWSLLGGSVWYTQELPLNGANKMSLAGWEDCPNKSPRGKGDVTTYRIAPRPAVCTVPEWASHAAWRSVKTCAFWDSNRCYLRRLSGEERERGLNWWQMGVRFQ